MINDKRKQKESETSSPPMRKFCYLTFLQAPEAIYYREIYLWVNVNAYPIVASGINE